MKNSTTCHVCGKPLENEVSVLLGIGPDCLKKSLVDRIERNKHGDFFDSKHPIYDFSVQVVDGVKVLVILDLSAEYECRTVTNSVDEVLDEIFHIGNGLPDAVIYKDSLGSWDRILIDDKGKFQGFAPIVVGQHGNTIADNQAAKLAVKSNKAEAA